jgi:hypothetical protein
MTMSEGILEGIFMSEIVLLSVQVIAAFGVVVSVFYLGVQVHQQNEITRAQFGHSTSNRLYERYFQSAKDSEYAEFSAKNWADEDLTDGEKWRIAMFVNTCMVDLCDVYQKVQQGFVDKSHLEMRVHFLRLGVMKTAIGKRSWGYWKLLFEPDFISWFEVEIYGEKLTENLLDGTSELSNIRRD